MDRSPSKRGDPKPPLCVRRVSSTGRVSVTKRRGALCRLSGSGRYSPSSRLSLLEPNAVDELDRASHLRREVLDVGEMVPVELVAEVVRAERHGVHGVACGDLV